MTFSMKDDAYERAGKSVKCLMVEYLPVTRWRSEAR